LTSINYFFCIIQANGFYDGVAMTYNFCSNILFLPTTTISMSQDNFVLQRVVYGAGTADSSGAPEFTPGF